MKNNRQSLTLIIPVYNTDLSLLERCLKSIPVHNKVNVFIYDDCSTEYNAKDEIISIIDKNPDLKFILDDKNKIIRMPGNVGLGFIRNKAVKDLYESIEEDECKYVMFLDSDDEVTFNEVSIDKVLNWKFDAMSYGIELIHNGEVHREDSMKYLSQSMIPYLVTPIIYNVKFLYDFNILFDESRRIFEDIPFSIKFWTFMISSHDDEFDPIEFYCKDTPVYRYHLDSSNSLTRNDKLERMIGDLEYWIDWMINYYHHITDKHLKDKVKPYIFNRIRYESVKVLSMKMQVNGDYDKYMNSLNYLKPYKINDILN